MKKIVLIGNHHVALLNFRKELIQKLLESGYEVITALLVTEAASELEEMGCKVVDIPVSRRTTNPIVDFHLFCQYFKLIRREKPEIVLTYTIKPNIYGGMACRLLKVPYLVNITGVGSAMETPGSLRNFITGMYRSAMKKADCIFFQNEKNKALFHTLKIKGKAEELLPGSGVNLNHFQYHNLPDSTGIKFVYISRVMREKGIEQYIEAAMQIKAKYPDTEFHILGFCEEEYEGKLAELETKGIVFYHGMQKDVRVYLEKVHCLIHPSYYPEGISNVCLEAASYGRAVITTRRAGCAETVDDGVTGYLVAEKSTEELVAAIEKYILLPESEKEKMGRMARKKMENEFSREKVVNAYMKAISKAETRG